MRVLAYVAASLGVLLSLAVLALIAYGHRTEAGRVRSAIEIQRPPGVVFPWITDGPHLTQWVSWLKEVRALAPGPLGAGSRVVWVMEDPNMGGPVEVGAEYLRYEEGRGFDVQIAMARAFDGTTRYLLTDLGAGRTRLEQDGTYHYQQWFARLLEPLVTPQAQKKLEGDLARLKQLVEAEPATAMR
jgi:uncharacterized protein YndB with AHSA1/START domain